MRAVRLTFVLVSLAATAATAQLPADSVARATPRGFSIGVIDSTDPALSAAPTLAHALQARLPGVSVSLGQGILGSSSRVWLRGPSSIVVNEPLLIIDGARTHSSSPSRGFIERDLPSRLEDIDMEAVERVEVLRGPAASVIYGLGASKGVILVTTKRGRRGPPRWTAFAEAGPSFETTAFPANFGPVGGTTFLGECTLAQQAERRCTTTGFQSFNPLESASPFQPGWTKGGGLSVSGGAGPVSFFAAGNHDRAEGVLATDRSTATSGRISLAASPTSTLDVHLTGGLRRDRLRHPVASWIRAGLFGQAFDDPVRRGYSGTYDELLRLARTEEVQRTTATLNTTWRPRPWLRATAMLGYDRLGVEASERFRSPSVPNPGDSLTSINDALDLPQTRTAGVEGSATYSLRGLAARSVFGAQYVRDDDRGRSSLKIIPDGASEPNAQSESAMNTWRRSLGAYVQQQVAWNDRVFVTGSVRVDRPTNGRLDLDNIVARSIDVSWLGIDSASTRSSKWLGELRLRGAYGRGGDHGILTTVQGQFFPPSAATLAAEQGAEIEAGVDASLLRGRVRAGVTYYRANTRRGLVASPVSGGQSPILSSTARVETSGVESSVDATLLATSRFAWDVGAVVSAHDHEIVSMGSPGYRIMGGQTFSPGQPIGESISAPYSYLDANGDGLLAVSEVVVLNGESGSVGSPFPKYEGALRTGMAFGDGVHLSAIIDHRGGAKLFNEAAFLRCRTRCREQNDPATSLEDQARPVSRLAGTEFAYIEDAGYTKLREVRLALALPRRVARMGGASSVRFTLIGRNLHTWTAYTGLDPEVTSARYDTIVASENFYQPTLRSFTARIDLVW